MSDEARHREVLELAYARLRERLEAKDVTAESLRSAAFDALEQAKEQVELDPVWVAGELARMRGDAPPDGKEG